MYIKWRSIRNQAVNQSINQSTVHPPVFPDFEGASHRTSVPRKEAFKTSTWLAVKTQLMRKRCGNQNKQKGEKNRRNWPNGWRSLALRMPVISSSQKSKLSNASVSIRISPSPPEIPVQSMALARRNGLGRGSGGEGGRQTTSSSSSSSRQITSSSSSLTSMRPSSDATESRDDLKEKLKRF